MKPSETTAGRAWLDNFDEPDRRWARLLLDGVRFVGMSDLRDGLSDHLAQLVAAKAFRTPAVAIPERGLEDFGVKGPARSTAVAYDHFDPGKDLEVTPGSEAFVGMVLRDLPGIANQRSDASAWISPAVDLKDLGDQRCRSIVVVTDYIGSGSRVRSLVDALVRNRTIRSWLSFGWIEIHVAAYAASPPAVDALEAHERISGVWVYEPGITFDSAPWTSEARQKIIDLCRTKSLEGEQFALGYRATQGLFATQRGAPNNLPAVLWQAKSGWIPLFEERVVPTGFTQELAGYRPSEDLRAQAERIGQERIGRNRRLDDMRPASRSVLQALLQLNKGRRDALQLAAELNVDVAHAAAIVEFVSRLGWVDGTGAITSRGRDEIAANKQGLRRTSAELRGNSGVYYPHSLR